MQHFIKAAAHKHANFELSPLHQEGPIREFYRIYDNLGPKWQKLWSKIMETRSDQYHAPIVQGSNGQWYSQSDMDNLMFQ